MTHHFGETEQNEKRKILRQEFEPDYTYLNTTRSYGDIYKFSSAFVDEMIINLNKFDNQTYTVNCEKSKENLTSTA